ncbi:MULTISPECIES: FliM/FliN family flagellar motor switch protein [Vibrio]|uniref:Flagellar motor switch protein FliM n=1 Tax=Vibrio bivalvicida TaxID=1276888 RepID=A0A177XZG4_9VIBR|nr:MULTISPECIES: FliM/FliN family flagellar motor C-terminal domain-containing protein [Vibrio]KLN66217.1 flagellar motor switch protein FliM [Vibrio sp. VPAP30]OAJ93970.1 flagellar motor switch protein FliM [Vibrio bivalvicida]
MEPRTKMFIPDYQALNIESLGKPIHVIRERLESLMSSSCNNLTCELQSWLKSSLVHACIKQVSLHTMTANEMDKATTSTFQHDGGGKVYINGDKATLIKLADSFYDAKMKRTSEVLSNSDLRLQERLGRQMTSWLAPQQMWSSCEFEPAQGNGLWAKIEISLPEHQGMVHLKLDEKLVTTLTEQLNLQANDAMSEPFCRSLTSTPVKLNVLLSKKELPLSEIISLQPNDVLPIELLSTVPVSIGDEHLFNGRVAEKDGQLVLIINHDKESL